MKTTSSTGTRSNRRGAGGFTLIELILVMCLLIIGASLITPSLKKFFGGRNVDSEVRRFVALMHYGQSRAVAEGVPMMLWIDSTKGTYGLEQRPGYADKDTKAVKNDLLDGVTMAVSRERPKTMLANSQTGRIQAGQATVNRNALPAIYFLPEGIIDNSMSITGISFKEGDNPAVWITPSGTTPSSEIDKQNTGTTRR